MLVSVIIPTFNRAHVLERAVQSVLNQTYKNLELIVIDDGSSDGTQELLRNISDSSLMVLSQQNLGVSHARNVGISKSKGEWISFLDSDDEWLPSKLSKQVEFIQKNPQRKIVHTNEMWIRKGIRVNPMKKHFKEGGDIFCRSTELCLMSPSTIMIQRDLLKKEKFNEEMVVCEDYDLWLRLLKDYEAGYIDEMLIKKYGGHEDQLSRKYHSMDYFRVKSLGNILKENLKNHHREKAKEVLLKKCEVLLKGYKKHNNLEHYPEVLSLFHIAQDCNEQIQNLKPLS